MTRNNAREVDELARNIASHPHFRSALRKSVAGRRGQQRAACARSNSQSNITQTDTRNESATFGRFQSMEQEMASLFHRSRLGSSSIRSRSRSEITPCTERGIRP